MSNARNRAEQLAAQSVYISGTVVRTNWNHSAGVVKHITFTQTDEHATHPELPIINNHIEIRNDGDYTWECAMCMSEVQGGSLYPTLVRIREGTPDTIISYGYIARSDPALTTGFHYTGELLAGDRLRIQVTGDGASRSTWMYGSYHTQWTLSRKK